ncbi:hypothetical protein [Empedobacter sedimenti]|uniref:hypothetical protein n=1 Tax=Empedobacter sedimenti TaxID=3042610 RepID=UPI0024A64127|nr:hypothetical protein [Empedobacter sedimenti]
MNLKIKILFGLVLLGLMTSCDPLRTLTLKTKKESTSIKIHFKNEAEKISAFEKASNPLEVSAQGKRKFTTYFRIGYWNDENIQDDLTQNIDSIVIQTDKKKEFYKTPESIQEFLKKKRKFFSKSRIEIKE